MDYTRENIKTMLEVWGVSQSKLSIALGLSQYALSHMLKPGAKNISSILVPLEEISGIPARRIVGEGLGYNEIPLPHYDFRLMQKKETAGKIHVIEEGAGKYTVDEQDLREQIVYLQSRVLRNEAEMEKMKQEIFHLKNVIYEIRKLAGLHRDDDVY